ncbi:hypothetical protein PsorP6_001193 [Peronosclerospora sorghi]|uniref:Uncharacterized protein n=1 Tax=Peronosclerospora sorghi TaxID=230839 RepID=A0ACC0WX24_9STRA|nr:hypothetical protein PsorP6_001193 [Peronosclerospora sorghi]
MPPIPNGPPTILPEIDLSNSSTPSPNAILSPDGPPTVPPEIDLSTSSTPSPNAILSPDGPPTVLPEIDLPNGLPTNLSPEAFLSTPSPNVSTDAPSSDLPPVTDLNTAEAPSMSTPSPSTENSTTTSTSTQDKPSNETSSTLLPGDSTTNSSSDQTSTKPPRDTTTDSSNETPMPIPDSTLNKTETDTSANTNTTDNSSGSSPMESPTPVTPAPMESPPPVTPAPMESPPPVTAAPDNPADKNISPREPEVKKSPIAIETNPEVEVEQDPTEQMDQTQSDVVMYNASAPTPIHEETGSYDPFALLPSEGIETEKPVVLNIAADTATSHSDDLVTYVRSKTAMSGDGDALVDGNVIGGRNVYVNTEDSKVLSSTAAAFHDFVRYASVAFAGISVALLLFFHFVSLDADLVWLNAAWSPNTWEFVFYVGYLQQMQSMSELTLLKTPYFLWDFTDSFSWSNFLIQDTVSTPESRRLDTIVLGGLVSYADRINIPEENILTYGAVGFAVIMCFLLFVFFVLAVLAKRKAERALNDSSDLNNYTSGVHRLRSVSIRALGLCVLLWYFALFPLSMLASFEITMEIQAAKIADALVVAIIALVLVCFGVLALAGRVVMHKSKDELEQFENLATWGSLYCEYTYHSRMFFVVDVVVLITTGVLVGTISGDPTQLIVVMAIEALYLGCVFVMSPFANNIVLRITYILGFVKIMNYGLAFAFLNSNTMSATARSQVAEAYIGINSIVILVWFIRQLIVFSTYIRAWLVRSNHESRRSNSMVKYEAHTDNDADNWASNYKRDLNQNSNGLNQSVNAATLSLPANSSAQSMQSSYQTSSLNLQTYSHVSSVPSYDSEAQFQHEMARKYEIGF